MKIAIIGRGTAGQMAAAHLTKHFPSAELYHIYDAAIPTIGVGEGTTPPFKSWLHELTSLSFAELQEACDATYKAGINFEHWGPGCGEYLHTFSPIEGMAYHISAAKLVDLLENYTTATCLDRKVTALASDGTQVTVSFEDFPPIVVDFCFDARGFPNQLTDRHVRLEAIPTNAAVIRPGEAGDPATVTRSVARPHGWIFVIPLASHRSFGYVYNDAINSRAEIMADFDLFLETEGVNLIGPERWLRFPNFVQRRTFDGALFKLGNAASFLEPLEATAIGMIVLQLQVASMWLYDRMLGLSQKDESDRTLQIINESFLATVQKVAIFVSWHYATGSSFQTPFWQYAISSFQRAPESVTHREIFADFERYVQVGAHFPEAMGSIRSLHDFEHIEMPQTSISKTFGGFLDMSFAQVGYGIDYYSNS